MTWLTQQHECQPPVDEVPQVEGFVRYWLCDACGKQYRVSVGEYGARWTGPDGQSGPSVWWQEVGR